MYSYIRVPRGDGVGGWGGGIFPKRYDPDPLPRDNIHVANLGL